VVVIELATGASHHNGIIYQMDWLPQTQFRIRVFNSSEAVQLLNLAVV
jgi:hypothetical protein